MHLACFKGVPNSRFVSSGSTGTPNLGTSETHSNALATCQAEAKPSPPACVSGPRPAPHVYKNSNKSPGTQVRSRSLRIQRKCEIKPPAANPTLDVIGGPLTTTNTATASRITCNQIGLKRLLWDSVSLGLERDQGADGNLWKSQGGRRKTKHGCTYTLVILSRDAKRV
eukprot:GHVT01077729.1.p1 GENE.GHVT01077729.1~~GHVT01077729.1.p1  ORF type:complete len:169 (+),score=18.55 GHVT01077729.1:232-738(+)